MVVVGGRSNRKAFAIVLLLSGVIVSSFRSFVERNGSCSMSTVKRDRDLPFLPLGRVD